MDPLPVAVIVLLVAGAAVAVTAAVAAHIGRDQRARVVALEEEIAAIRARSVGDAVGLRRAEHALDHVEHGVVIADTEGAIVASNPMARTFLGGRHIDAIVDHRIRDLLARTLESGEPDAFELELLGPPERYLRLASFPLAEDEPIGAAVFVIDMTEARRTDAVRRDFVANISHELKTPVAALGLLAETLRDVLDEPDVAERLATRLVNESRRLVRIIDDLLALSRLEVEDSPRREAVSIDLVVAEAVERVRSGFFGEDVLIRTDVTADLAVAGDRRQLTSAVYNLVENAVKYSEPGSPVDVVAELTGDTAELRITDSGAGIPTRDHDRIFERFYRVDRARSRATGGTGLGLAIVRHVVQNHGGTVAVSSELGIGSTFTVRIPGATIAVPERNGAAALHPDNRTPAPAAAANGTRPQETRAAP